MSPVVICESGGSRWSRRDITVNGSHVVGKLSELMNELIDGLGKAMDVYKGMSNSE